jgi:hypothetical protein
MVRAWREPVHEAHPAGKPSAARALVSPATATALGVLVLAWVMQKSLEPTHLSVWISNSR